MSRLKAPPGLVPALDMPLGRALLYLDRLKGLKDAVTGVKYGSDIADRYGNLTAFALFEDIGLEFPIIYDRQKGGSDIPDQVRKQVREAARLGVVAYIGQTLGSGANPSATEEKVFGTTEAMIDQCKKGGLEPVLVLEMTQPGATHFLREGASEDLARYAKDRGVRYFVAPATRPERIEVYRKIIGDECEIISPGIGPQKTGDPVKDAESAVRAGADHLVIGRALIDAEDPVDLGRRIFEAVVKARESR